MEENNIEALKGKVAKKAAVEMLTISAPNFKTALFRLNGTSPYMQNRFPNKVVQQLREKMEAGSTSKKGKKRDARDFEADFQNAQHVSGEGWIGIPASAFRIACVDACRVVGYKMTVAKMSFFVEADGLDKVDAMPLVRLDAPAPERNELAVRNATGVVDIRVRPLWREWACNLKVRYDADQFTLPDVTNLLARAGIQVGVGEGRPFSKNSVGLGFGTFRVDVVDTQN